MAAGYIVRRIGGRISIFWRVCSIAAELRSCLARALEDRSENGREIHRFVTVATSFAISLGYGGFKGGLVSESGGDIKSCVHGRLMETRASKPHVT